MQNTIICIGRQFGSGGHEIALRTGTKTGLKVYDEEMITLACGKGEVREEILRPEDERPVNPFLFRTMHEGNEKVNRTKPAGDVLFDLQSMVIKDLAKAGDCIIVGRCADAVLKQEEIDVLSVFIQAPFDQRVKRKMELENLPLGKTVKLVTRTDRHRKKYYESHTGNEWGAGSTYDLLFDTGTMTFDEVADQIVTEYRKRKAAC